MDYIEVNIPITNNELGEILIAELSDLPFEGFEQNSTLIKAYIPQEILPDYKEQVDSIIAKYNISDSRYISIESKNWNQEWESNFERVEIEDKILIRAPFHTPDNRFEHEVVIMPKMSFGTGHHATTHLCSDMLTKMNISAKRGLDMGSGTGVLSIIAIKYGAESMDAIDIDEWAYENCSENLAQNNAEGKVTPHLGNALLLEGKNYDFVVANINLNILLSDMHRYILTLSGGGELIMSGFFVSDIPSLKAKAESLGMRYLGHNEREGWAVIHLVKQV
ncbi:MAG: 50S ribosomal protein L11 methyltransferase [Rikenellaceae bacterium]